nr:FtsX-like permease family protein [Rhodocyclus gracilis]
MAKVFLGSLARRRAATAFSFAAIVLGVSLGMAVQAVHEAALAEFGRGLRTMAGEADLQVVGGRVGFDESVYGLIAGQADVAAASPVIEFEARLAGRRETVQVVGADLFALARVTPALLPRPRAVDGKAPEPLAALADDAAFLGTAAQVALGVKPGEVLRVQAGVEVLPLRVLGDLPGMAENPRLVVMDIAAVQQRFERLGRLSRVDLRLREGVSPEAARSRLQALLPAGVLVEPPQAAENQAANLSRAYRVNLTLLAAMALVTGGFLVFSAQALSVVRRRTEFAFLRAIGLDRRRLFVWLLAEGALVGLAGGLVGAAAGYALASALLSVLGGDLGAGYFAGLTPQLHFQPEMTALYVALGVAAGVAGAWLPAREAATVSPARALKAGDEAALMQGRGHPLLGIVLLAASLAACAIPPFGELPLGGYLAVLLLLAGSILLLPLAAGALARHLPSGGAVPWRLALARLRAAPGHAVVAAAGVLTSVALAVAMAIMVTSFRDSVNEWLDHVLSADVYVRAGHQIGGAYLDEDLQQRILAQPGVAEVDFTRADSLRLQAGQVPVALIARPVIPDGRELALVGATQPGGGAEHLPDVWASEAVRDLYGWRTGQRVEVPLGGRRVAMHVAGIWRDYSRQTGTLMIDLTVYRQLTGDRLVNEAGIHLGPGGDAAAIVKTLLDSVPPGALEAALPGEIRAISLRIFDRTFAVTYLLEAVAVLIGLAGVAASFAALAAARRREFGMLRHLGLTRRQVGWMLAAEGALAAGVGVLGGLVAGGAIGLVLIEVVNRQSFHWSMDLHVPWGSLVVFAGGLVALAALAAVLAGRQAMRQEAVLAVREDW